MKKVTLVIIALFALNCELGAQTKVYNREIGLSYGFLTTNYNHGETVPYYGFRVARFNDWGGGLGIGVNYAEIPYSGSVFASVPIQASWRFDVPWFVGLDLFDDLFWTMAAEAETFEQSMFYIVAGAIVAFLPKRFELSCGISPGYVGCYNDNHTYYTGDILTREGFGCSADFGLRATAKMGRLGLFIAPTINWQLTPSLYFHDTYYDEHRLFVSYCCGLSLAF